MKISDLDKIDETENKRENLIAFSIVFFVFVVIAWLIYSAVTEPEASQDRIIISAGASPALGLRDAPVEVVMFSDFECPYCASFARDSFPVIKERFIDTNQIHFSFKHFPLTQIHPYALRAAEAASCAYDQQMFWEYHDILYEHQDELEVNQLLSYATQLAMDQELFEECLISERRRDEVIREKDQGIKAGVTGTPTFFFNGRPVVGVLSPEEFAQEVAKELA